MSTKASLQYWCIGSSQRWHISWHLYRETLDDSYRLEIWGFGRRLIHRRVTRLVNLLGLDNEG